MDVSTISNVITQNFEQVTAKNKNAARFAYASHTETVAQFQNENSTFTAAFALDISFEARQAHAAQQEFMAEIDDSAVKGKGLSASAIDQLQQESEANEQTFLNLMIQAMSASNDKLKGWLDSGTGILNFGGTRIDAARFALPEVATNAEDAAKAVDEGGAWSVDAVSSRIFDLATAIAGNDPEKLATMRAAVEEGFKQAGATWTDATGMNDMPDITQKTYQELMHRFDNFGNLNA
ncbi:MAG: hypothetical protein J5809_04125 [Selenomonadaceae bacterium]|nr:hypothetical protein [Selenomonadaceae bacterium]